MRVKDLAAYAIKKGIDNGVIKTTDKPTRGDYIEDLLYKWFCILTVIFLFL